MTTACAPEPQTRLTVIAGTRHRKAAADRRLAAGFIRLPAWMTLPITTEPTAAGSSPERRSVSRTTAAPSSVAGVSLSDPLKAPIAVRTGLQMTIWSGAEAAMDFFSLLSRDGIESRR